MPIARTFMCSECGHRLEVVLSADDWDAQPPNCPQCDFNEQMHQEFRPPAIGGSTSSKAHAIAEDIMANDYQVANAQFDNREGGKPKVRYKDQTGALPPAAWANAQAQLAQAVDLGRAHRHHRYADGPQGNGLDVLKAALESGSQPDLIANSRKRAIKVW